MTAPVDELQGAIVALVEADTALMALIGGIYDRVPDGPHDGKAAYLSFGPETVVPGQHECLRLEEAVVQIDVWSTAYGRTECKTICQMLKALLHLQPLSLSENACVQARLVLQRILPDPREGVTHGVMQFEFYLEDMT